MNNQILSELKVKFLNLFKSNSNKKTSESPEITKQKINYNKVNEFGYPSELQEKNKQTKRTSPIYFKRF